MTEDAARSGELRAASSHVSRGGGGHWSPAVFFWKITRLKPLRASS